MGEPAGGEVLDRFPDAARFDGVSVTSRTQHVPQVGEPLDDALSTSFWVQREHRQKRILCSGEVTTQGPGRGEIHSRTKLTGDKPGPFGHLAEQCQGGGGLDFGLRTVAQSNKRCSGAQRAAGVVESEFTADLIQEWITSRALQLVGCSVKRGTDLLPRTDQRQ